MTGDGLLELRRRTTLVRGINPRGPRHWGAASRRQTCIPQVRLDPNHDAVMRIGGEAPGGGPILSVGIWCHVSNRFPPPRIVRPAVLVVDASSERRAGKEKILQRFVSLPDAG
jgi:hypothetical protein